MKNITNCINGKSKWVSSPNIKLIMPVTTILDPYLPIILMNNSNNMTEKFDLCSN